MVYQQNDKNTEARPFGCFFDVYGFDEKFLPSLNCNNCPISGMMCEYKVYVNAARLASIVSTLKKIEIISDP
ncbi:MAG: hypothetical protein QXN93_05730 [Methanomassiliicoccales archaeon]